MSKQGTPTRSDALPLETALSLLGNEYRRATVTFLAKRETTVTLDELASVVGSSETAGPATDSPAAVRKRVKSALHHVHLPKLADANVVEYDYSAHTVTPLAVDELVPFLRDDASTA